MGTPELSAVPTSDKQTQTMKVFVLLCVVAAAMDDADPYLVYSGYGGLHHGGAGYSYGYPYATTYHYGKREAEAEPYYYGGYYGGYRAYRPYSYGYGRFGYYG